MHACMQAVDGQAESMDYTHGRSILSAALQSQAPPTRPHLASTEVRSQKGSQTLPAQSCCPSFSLHSHVLCRLSLLIPFTCSLEMPVVLIPQVFCPRNVLSSLPPSHHLSLSHYVLIDLCVCFRVVLGMTDCVPICLCYNVNKKPQAAIYLGQFNAS